MDGEPSTERASLWTALAAPEFAQLAGDTRADVAIVGAGIVGLTAAQQLQRRGLDVVLLEGRRVGRQVTGLSTAKVTSQHSLAYSRLERSFGRNTAQAYADANQAGLQQIIATVEEVGIDCHLERQPAYTYTTDGARVSELEREARVATHLGLPARFTRSVPLPFEVAGAVVFGEQAQFDPYAYLQGLAWHLSPSVRIFEETRVLDVHDGDPCRIETDHGVVTADHVIVATNIPFADRGLYFARTFPIAHAVIAASVEGEPQEGMFISIDTPSRSIRGARTDDGAWLILAGSGYRPGTVDTAAEIATLEEFARQHYPVADVVHRWTNEDHQSVDGLPYVGKLIPTSKHVYVATGFGGWGITNGTAAGTILADLVTEQDNPWSAVFDSSRVKPVASAARFVRENMQTGALFVRRFTRRGNADLAALQPGEGVVVKVEGGPAAVSRGDDGALCAVSSICTHQGCVVEWNTAMRTWDCPCHGSIFASDGAVIHGPATEPLAPIELLERVREGAEESGEPSPQ